MIPQSLLDTIIADPLSDDTPRLITADYLEELNTPESRDRAEFIRVQVALASLGSPPKVGTVEESYSYTRNEVSAFVAEYSNMRVGDRVDLTVPPGVLEPGARMQYYGLLVREIDGAGRVTFLIDEHSRPWAGEALKRREQELMTPYNLALWSLGIKVLIPLALFRRGFVDEVHGTQDWWIKHGPTIVRDHPLTVVRLTDRTPGSFYHGWQRHEGGEDQPYRLHPQLWDTLSRINVPGRTSAVNYEDDNGYWSLFIDHTHSIHALSQACLTWAKTTGSLTSQRKTMTLLP